LFDTQMCILHIPKANFFACSHFPTLEEAGSTQGISLLPKIEIQLNVIRLLQISCW
jgi:hypothetical protein